MKIISASLSKYKREFFLIFLSLLGLTVFVPIFTYLYFAKDLISREAIINSKDTGLLLLDRNNIPFFSFYHATYSTFLPLSQIPLSIQHTVLASEDKDFYHHSGYSLPAIFRALFVDLIKHDSLYGGSTITQQLVKNSFLNSNKNYMRKIQEIVLAQEIERRYSKNEILEMYLNSAYFGEGAFGVENAALTYFNIHAKNLTISQDAFLTAVLPSPSELSPFSGNIAQAKLRQQIILEKLYDQHYITRAELVQAQKQPLVFHPAQSNMNVLAPHFAIMVRDQLIKQFGEERISSSGFRVKTTLDSTWQDYAEKSVTKQVENLKGDNVSNGAAVVLDPKTGDVKALVGSADWFDEKFGKLNMAITPRSVGSSFKPIVYSAAFEEKLITPATVLQDVPTTFPGGYKPLDYDRKYRGSVAVRRALANSLNIPAVEVMQKVGLTNALTISQRLGITTLKDPSNYGLSLVLGSGEVPLIELTNVYGAFANRGIQPDVRTILEIDDKQGKKIYSSSVHHKKVLAPEVAFLISSILSDNHARAEEFGNLLDVPFTAAVKTGTAEDFRDAITMGYTPNLAVGVWVGNNDNTPMDTVAGSLGAAPIWKDLMTHFTTHPAADPFPPPAGIQQLTFCQGGSKEYFTQGTGPDPCIWTFPSPSQIGVSPTSIHLFTHTQNDEQNTLLTPQPTLINIDKRNETKF